MTLKVYILGKDESLNLECLDDLSDKQIIEYAEKALTDEQRSRWAAIYIVQEGTNQPKVILNDS